MPHITLSDSVILAMLNYLSKNRKITRKTATKPREAPTAATKPETTTTTTAPTSQPYAYANRCDGAVRTILECLVLFSLSCVEHSGI